MTVSRPSGRSPATSSKPAARQASSRSASGPNSSRFSSHRARDQRRPLRQPRHLRPPLPWVEVGDVVAVDQHPARRRRDEAEDGLQRGGLARAVGSGQHRHRAGLDVGGQPVRCIAVPTGDADVPRRIEVLDGVPVSGGGVAVSSSSAAAFAPRSCRPGRRGTPRRRGAAARTPRARAAAPSGPAARSTSPNTSRKPTLTATRATPRVASSSSTSADRNVMRSVAIVERRCAAASSAIRRSGRRRGRAPAGWGCR